MAKTDVWMPLYIGDYLADTTRLTTEQHGAYLLLIMDYWRNGPPPDNPAILQQITRMTEHAWSIAQASIKHFFVVDNGVWNHARIDFEMALAKENRGRASEKARLAAETRWKNAPSNAPSMLQAMLDECPSPSPSPSSLQSTSKSTSKDKNNVIETEPKNAKTKKNEKFDTKKFLAEKNADAKLIEDWLAVRKLKKLANTETAMAGFVAQVEKSGLTINEVLQKCCEKSWGGFKAEWLENEAGQQIGKRQESVYEKKLRENMEWNERLDRAIGVKKNEIIDIN